MPVSQILIVWYLQNGRPALPGPPYKSPIATLGGLPTVSLDVPITSVFLFLFVVGAIGHMTVLQINLRRGHKFTMSGAMFGFCLARTIAGAMRITWATKPQNVSVEIAATIFIAIGDLVGFIVNLNLAQRILRAVHPGVGWHPALKIGFIVVYSLIFVSLCLLVGFALDSYYTLDPTKLKHSRDVELYGTTYFAFTAILPLPLLLAVLCMPRKNDIEHFGTGSFRSKIMIVLFGSTVLSLGAWFRCSTNYLTPRPVTHPAPYQSKTCFYIFYFSLEVIVIYTYLIVRFDRRFHVPNGSKGPGDYSKSMHNEKRDEETPEEHTPKEQTPESETTASQEHSEMFDPENKVSEAETTASQEQNGTAVPNNKDPEVGATSSPEQNGMAVSDSNVPEAEKTASPEHTKTAVPEINLPEVDTVAGEEHTENAVPETKENDTAVPVQEA